MAGSDELQIRCLKKCDRYAWHLEEDTEQWEPVLAALKPFPPRGCSTGLTRAAVGSYADCGYVLTLMCVCQ